MRGGGGGSVGYALRVQTSHGITGRAGAASVCAGGVEYTGYEEVASGALFGLSVQQVYASTPAGDERAARGDPPYKGCGAAACVDACFG